ncbi:MAG: hypothetical protein HYR74_10460 [Candidatus Eisenbacteria bacterium]|nr:hypothetical protein [Candidatus Eisenbacteria bacterium]
MIEAWCRSHAVARGGVATLDQLWRLSAAWNAGRLDHDPRRPGPAQARAIFAGAGLAGPFWDPESDAFD